MKLGKFIDEKGADKITFIAVDWLESQYGADANRLDRWLKRIIHPSMTVVQGTEETSRMFGGIASVPAYVLYDHNGRHVISLGGPATEQSRHRIELGELERVISAQ